MKKIISVIVSVLMLLTALPLFAVNADEGIELPPDPFNPFIDVKEGKWYTDAVLWCYFNGYMKGMSDDVFGVKTPVNRAMFVTILAKIAKADLSGYTKDTEGLPFTDVKSGAYYVKALKWAYENKHTAGVSDTKFGTGDPVTREQLATFLYAYTKSLGGDLVTDADLSSYADGASVSKYARKAMSWALTYGLISGTGNNMLSPKQSALREQVALILKNYIEIYLIASKRAQIEYDGTKALIHDAEDVAYVLYANGDAYTEAEFDTAYRMQFGISAEEMTEEFISAHNCVANDGEDELAVEGLYGSTTLQIRYKDGTLDRYSHFFDPGNEYPVGCITLAGTDISEYTVVYGTFRRVENMSAADLANEFAKEIKKMTGAELSVVSDSALAPVSGAKEILIGHTNREEAGIVTVDRSALIYDTFHIEIQNGCLILTGNEGCGGTHVAVYEFLRRAGCTYYTADISVIQPAEKMEFAEGYKIHVRPTMDAHTNYQYGGWCPRIGLTSETGWRFCNIVHTLPEFAAEDYEDTWPCHLKYYMSADPCLTNSENIRRIIKNVKTKISNAIAQGNPEPLVWLTLSDGSAQGCRCANCGKVYSTFGYHSTYTYILFYVAEAIKDEFPTAKVVGLAYKYTITAPKLDVSDEDYAAFLENWNEDFTPPQHAKAPSGAVMCVASDNSCFSHELEDPNCHNKTNGNPKFIENFERYREIFDTLFVWEYPVGGMYVHAIFPNIYQLWSNYNYYYRQGVCGMYANGHASRYADFSELHTYIDAILSLDASYFLEKMFYKHNF